MKSQWFHLKEEAVELRTAGTSITVIERMLGIPRSTPSGWFKHIQRTRLIQNRRDSWQLARKRAVESHNAQKAQRMLTATKEATDVLNRLEINNNILDLAFAMLYLGEGAKNNTTSLASSDPKILKFVLKVLERNYNVQRNEVRCDLHLRMDQNEQELKTFWSQQLSVPIDRFKYVTFDKRSEGKKTYDHYKGVCVLYCGSIAIQRKLIYLYNLFCERVAELDTGV